MVTQHRHGSTRMPFHKRARGRPTSGPPDEASGSVRQVVVFCVLTYAFTWSLFLAAKPMASGSRTALILVGALGPSLVAVLLTARSDGRSGVRALLGRLLRWRVKIRWYAFALGYMAVVKLAVAVVYRMTHGHWPRFGEHSVATIVVLIVVVGIIGGPLGEEVGWRGYALPRLTQRFGLAPASLLLGVVWSLWHLPLFVLSVGGDQFEQSFPTYLLQVTALSVAMAWLMGNTGGSLLLAVLFHSAINQTKDIVPSTVTGAHHAWALSTSSVAWLTVAVLWVGAGYFLSRMPWHGVATQLEVAPKGAASDTAPVERTHLPLTRAD
jgi:membrane protease YdiL (CAAX protease family)